jgi:hypothetical protein
VREGTGRRRRPPNEGRAAAKSFVLSELARQLTWSEQTADVYHYRDHNKVEVDAVLENRAGQVVGIEVKAASTVGPETSAGCGGWPSGSATTLSPASCSTPAPRRCRSVIGCEQCR